MWMMGYSSKEGGGVDPMGRKQLRPLMPRHSSTTTSEAAVVVSSWRWNPTAEQLRVLEDLYRRGTRTPTADQIQHITLQLRRYGKIEGKNVFYWFQNHKARERQKRRRQIQSSSPPPHNLMTLSLKHPGSSRTGYEVEQTKNWLYSTVSTTQPQHEEAVTRGKATMAVMAGDCRAEKRWVHLNGGGGGGGDFIDSSLLQTSTTHHRRDFLRTNATWHMLHMPPGNTTTHHHHPLFFNSTTVSSISSTSSSNMNNNTVCSSSSSSAKATVTVPHVFLSTRPMMNARDGHQDCDESHDQTLQLFPLSKEEEEEEEEEDCSNGNGELMNEKVSDVELMNGFSCFSPVQRFYEFLPLKN